MLAVLRINNIIADRAAPELTTKLCGSFQEVRRYLDKRAVVFFMSFTPLLRKSSMKSSLVIVLFLGRFRTLARFKSDRVGVDHVVIKTFQRAVALIGVLMLVVALARRNFLITVRTKHYSSLHK